MTPSVDSFQALARSSPWRWRTLHFRYRDDTEHVEAWVRRPGDLVVRTADGRRHRVRDHGSGTGRGPVARRPDGLVAERPQAWVDEHDDPMWSNYRWVAMLDPVELSHHVDVANLREDEVAGRPVWRADLRARPGYEPRCGGNCCELLWSEASWFSDDDGPDDPHATPVPPGTVFPDHYDVALDVGTGVVVRLHPVGGTAGRLWLEVDIVEVDADLDDVFG